MKTKYPSMFGVLAALLLVASFIIPTNLATPSPVEAGICKWDTVDMPGSVAARADILTPSELTKIAVGSDGATILAIVNGGVAAMGGVVRPYLQASNMMGLMWSPTAYMNLVNSTGATLGTQYLFDVAIAPDNPAFWAVVTGDALVQSPLEVWITENAGGKWERTRLVEAATAVGYAGPIEVGAIDISVDYGGQRDIAVGMREGAGALNCSIFVLQSKGFTGWEYQQSPLATSFPNNLPPHTVGPIMPDGDVYALRFSPTYAADGALAIVFTMANGAAVDNGTWYNVALRDIDTNIINQWAFPTNVEVCLPANTGTGVSPTAAELITADLELPSDFSGQAASLRRAYVSTDTGAGVLADDGIFRMDNTTVYSLMDTSTDTFRRVATITYFGTYASGKLLAGSVLGWTCQASVPTWFTDSPTTCPVPCWYDCMKCPTGSAGIGICTVATTSPGNAQVAWFQGGDLALALTGTYALTANNATNWWAPLVIAAPLIRDETALSISRNNGETWNQLALIDTLINNFNDFAISADCTTLYLASSSDNVTPGCINFDSVWRSSINPSVVAPLPPIPPVGLWYERVLTRPTAVDCEEAQSDLPLLRLVPGCVEPTGQIVGWAAQGTAAQAWSPDYGDYWANITARDNIQDFAFESSTILYNLYAFPVDTVHKLPYTGTSWGTTLPSVNPGFPFSHMITAMPEGQVMVGYNSAFAPYPVMLSKDGGATFAPLLQPLVSGNVHVAFDPAYAENSIVYIADDNAVTGSVYRQSVAGAPLVTRWADVDMMAAINGAVGSLAPHQVGQYGLALAFTGADGQCALYSIHQRTPPGAVPPALVVAPGACRTLWPLDGMPKPGIVWDCLNVGIPAANAVDFTREPSALKLCGCCTLDTDTTLYAIDNRPYAPPLGQNSVGMLWAFTDCLAKKGPALITKDKTLIGCDPVSGRSQEVDLCWEQLCVADAYDIEIAKQPDFTIRIIDWVIDGVPTGAVQPAWATLFLIPAELTSPCAYFPAGGQAVIAGTSALAQFGNLECGHTYYWRVQVRECATTQVVRSPWSEIKSFTIKAGLPVTTPYYGPQLLAPNNGCHGCPVSPASFSWSPFKETTKYKFVLATDAAMTQVVTEAEVSTTAFEYDGTLNYSTNYFWRVMALEPAPSDWSATFSFQTGTPSTLSVSQVPSKAGFWDALATPAKAMRAWAAELNIHPIPALPLLPWAWAAIAVGIILFVLWLLVMIVISKLAHRSYEKKD